MRPCFCLLFLSFSFWSCETNSFEKDKRQIAAKNAIRDQLPDAGYFDITGFKEDTLPSSDAVFKRQIRYRLRFVYRDSTGIVQSGTGEVFFTPDGKSLLHTTITGLHQ